MAKERLDERLRVWLEQKKEIIDVKLLNPEGKVIYVANERLMSRDLDNPLPDPTGKAFQEGAKGIYISEIFRGQGRGYNFGMLVTAPIFDFDKSFIGVLTFEINMEPIYEFIQDVTGLGESGGTLIVKKKPAGQAHRIT